MKTWLVDISFCFAFRSDSDTISNKEVSTCLIKRLSAGGIQASYFRVMPGKEMSVDFKDLA